MSDQMDDADPTDGGSDADGSHDELPAEVIEEAERLTRLARSVPEDAEAEAHAERRATLLDEHHFTARIRDEDGDAVLVLHPAEWHDDGVIRTDRIEDLSRAIERPLEGTGDPDDWSDVDAQNRELASAVRAAHGDVHGDNADALADFGSNHYAKPIESLTGPELTEFRLEYFVRNAWPSAAQRAVIDDSITLVYETAGETVPEYRFQ
ncbi:DUF7108 family protein [Natrarchaeobaculum sulfurireducens]|uniref:RnhA operon protein n=2 Tax=Natrarchaeobaculum sulfurireducens TaxID=2044521 RepID=A0A346PRE8_9EURY|nr:hypothetical protein AArcMg_2095 [Natrarchaeobaculum sulfurireducens]